MGVSQVYRLEVAENNITTIDLVSLVQCPNSKNNVNHTPADFDCLDPQISDDGRVVAFWTAVSLASEDENGNEDVYIRNYRLNPPITRLVSLGISSQASNNTCWYPSISGNGSVVVFSSKATNLVSPSPPGNVFNVYRVGIDGLNPQMEVVSLSDVGASPASCGGDSGDCTTYDIEEGIGKVVNEDGNLIVFQGSPKNALFQLQQGPTCRNAPFQNTQIFLRDLRNPLARRTYVVSARLSTCGNDRSVRPSITTDGTRIVFQSDATDFITNDANGHNTDVFFVDTSQVTGLNTVPVVVSMNSLGVQSNNYSAHSMITSDGSHIAFDSYATNLDEVPDTNGVADVFVRHLDVNPARTFRMSLDCANGEGDGRSEFPDIFLAGRAVVYESEATNLLDASNDDDLYAVFPDDNDIRDLYESRLKPQFWRGDVDGSGALDITDTIVLLDALFQGGEKPPSPDAADINDTGNIDLTDAIYSMDFQFHGGSAPLSPFPGCGFDPTDDCLSTSWPFADFGFMPGPSASAGLRGPLHFCAIPA